MRDRIFYSICFGILFFSILSKNKWGIIVSVFVLTFSLGILRFDMADKPASYIFESQVDKKVSLTGVIIEEPSIGENNQKLTVETGSESEKTKVLVSTSFGEDFKYGDEVNFVWKLEKPENFITDQCKEF